MSRVAVRYTDDQASFPDSVSTCLSFSGGPTLLRAEQLRGAKRCKVRLRLSRLRERMYALPERPCATGSREWQAAARQN